jgi:hypothetical protein
MARRLAEAHPVVARTHPLILSKGPISHRTALMATQLRIKNCEEVGQHYGRVPGRLTIELLRRCSTSGGWF